MTTKKGYLEAILAMRLEWSEQDKQLATQLANLRYRLDRDRAKSATASSTVPTAAGGEKANPIFSVIDRLSKQENQLTRRLQLGAQRTAGGQYKTNDSPSEARARLWEQWGDSCKEDLIPGLWLCVVKEAGVTIPEDSLGWPANPSQLPAKSGVKSN